MDAQMIYQNLHDLITRNRSALAAGPIAMVVVEDDVEVGTTLRHHHQLGFSTMIALVPNGVSLPKDVSEFVLEVRCDTYAPAALPDAVNMLIEACPGSWIYYCYNAEYLFFPFCESRSIVELLAFHSEERRRAMLAYTVDLYAENLDQTPSGVSLDTAHLDRSGYYALSRSDDDGTPKDRQLDFFGGLRWRFEEHVPGDRRKIDRIALFLAKKGLKLRADHTFNDEEYNTYACPWHHNLTATVCSFRAAKALRSNPGSRADIQSMMWHNSAPFEWHSRQLLDLGLMEPGQWF